jgi:hypothetical protein
MPVQEKNSGGERRHSCLKVTADETPGTNDRQGQMARILQAC